MNRARAGDDWLAGGGLAVFFAHASRTPFGQMAIGFLYCRDQNVTGAAADTSEFQPVSASTGASIVPESDPELAAIIEAWPTLAEDVRQTILTLIRASCPAD